LIKIESNLRFITPEERKEFDKEYHEKREALIAISKAEWYEGSDVSIPEDASAEDVLAIAEACKREASDMLGATGLLVLICLMAFIAAHAVGQGAVIWVFIAEIFPNDQRSAGQSLGSSTHWICAAGITTVFPFVISRFEPGLLFGFFCFMMILQLLWVQFMVPETKGITLEEMQKKLGIAEE
jgi:hypothetical protein